ncbi:MAG: hypothetical protein RSE91_00590 [Bacilli bacterium]
MKKNKIFSILFLTILCFLTPLMVFAQEESSCTSFEKNKLRQAAANIKYSYELYFDEITEAYFYRVTAYNLTKELLVHENYFNTTYEYDDARENKSTATNDGLVGGTSYQMTVFGSANSVCKDEIISSSYLTLHNYNPYSERKECKGIENYAYCQKYSDLEITEDEFIRKVNEYKNSLNKKPDILKPDVSNEKNMLSKFLSLYMDHLVYSVTITGVIVVLIGYLIYRKIKTIQGKSRYKTSRRRKI